MGISHSRDAGHGRGPLMQTNTSTMSDDPIVIIANTSSENIITCNHTWSLMIVY